jgi:pSer/pThr/pTyr-binding forkhead associated (FHA) protein
VTHTDVVVIKRGPNAGSQFRLNQPVRSARRVPDGNVFLDDINRQPPPRRPPARKRRTWVVAVGSLNGTYVNGEPIDAAVLTNGDEIEMGKFRLQVLTGAATGLTP